MKNSINLVMAFFLMLSITSANAQIKNATTETVKIFGNCGMCESTIEKAGNLKNVARVDWDKDTKQATLIYDANKTNRQEVLKRIALAGYDSDEFLAPTDAYNQLPGCCQYERVNKSPAKTNMMEMDMSQTEEVTKKAENTSSQKPNMHAGHIEHGKQASATPTKKQEADQLAAVFDEYFALKDALVETDHKLASENAKLLLTAINAVKMESLKMNEHMVWMKVKDNLMADTKNIAGAKNVSQQRNAFMLLSKNMYELIKAAENTTPIYYQFCPMANDGKGANWLSRDATIKNPFYGSQMLSCGKTVETIQ